TALEIRLGGVGGFVLGVGSAEAFDYERPEALSTDLRVERSAGREHRVADGLGFQTAWRVSPEEAGAPGLGRGRSVELGRLAVGFREQDQFVELFDAPTGADELGG